MADAVTHAPHALAGARHRTGALAAATLALCLLALCLLAAFTSSASALIVQLPGGKTLSYQPLRGARESADRMFSNLDYNGGPVMASNTNYAIYWDPTGGAAYPPDYRPGVDAYLADLAHDSGGHGNVDSVSTQYNDAAGQFASYDSHFGGDLLDTDPYPANGCTQASICLTDAQLQAELRKFVAARGLPADLAHEYFLLTPAGVEDCFQASGRECSAGSLRPVYCAYHGHIPTGGGQLVYATDPYVTGIEGCDDGNHPNGSSSDGALQGGLSHEHNESITDPEPNGAWTDIGGSGGEIGDKCDASMGAPLGTAENGASYNQVINGHPYWYQEEWSNQSNQCLQRFTFAGTTPTATYASTRGAGTEVTFDAGGSSASGGVAAYNWQFNDGPGLSRPTETTAPTVTHVFPADGIYRVALTVFASDGTSAGTAHAVVAGTPPPPVVKRVAPAAGPPAGATTVTITGTGFTEAGSVGFGATPAESFTVNSDTSITAVTPAHAAGSVDVTVTTPAGTSPSSSGDHFKFRPPTVAAVSPNAGPAAGGTPVTVGGAGFAPGTSATTFKFGTTKAASVNCSSLTTCTMLAPAHKAGTVDVRATVAQITSPKDLTTDAFSYH